jgi:hypothetical protein
MVAFKMIVKSVPRKRRPLPTFSNAALAPTLSWENAVPGIVIRTGGSASSGEPAEKRARRSAIIAISRQTVRSFNGTFMG